MDLPKINITSLHHTAPLARDESSRLDRMIATSIKESAGKNEPFRLQVGDKVEDFATTTPGRPVGTVEELYRENGHNRAMTEQGFFREQDLRVIKDK